MCSGGGASQGMGEGFVLSWGRGGRRTGRGEIGVFEVLGGERGEIVPDVGGDTGDGFLDLSWIVVGLVFVDTSNPMGSSSSSAKGEEDEKNRQLLQGREGIFEGIDAGFEILILWRK